MGWARAELRAQSWNRGGRPPGGQRQGTGRSARDPRGSGPSAGSGHSGRQARPVARVWAAVSERSEAMCCSGKY